MHSRSDDWRRTNVGRLLNNAARRFEARVFELLEEAGHTEVRLSQLHLTRSLGREGARITELAQRSGMTKQAMGELVTQCEALGLVMRRPDPHDARAKTVLFTRKGLVWLKAFGTALERTEAELTAELGASRTAALIEALRAYTGADAFVGEP